MSAITEILSQVPIDQLAGQLGASKKDTKSASTEVIASLLGGMTANTQDAAGEESLATALLKHRLNGESYASGGVDLDGIDLSEGTKIVQHALGTSPSKTAAALSAKTGTDKTLLQKLLPILAPIVIAYIANQAFSNKAAVSAPAAADPLGSIVGGLLGGGQSSGGADMVSSMLGGLLGGGGRNSSSGLGGMLGGMLGGALGNNQASKAQQSSGGVLGGLLDAIF
ncbi:MAG: DUF937 domain-containing protein [Propionibacteriaceae bacterium]|jgi:hypothetical protein|nr:DUF937 domain-containing protein [Propionibacteriaceae bacterium]